MRLGGVKSGHKEEALGQKKPIRGDAFKPGIIRRIVTVKIETEWIRAVRARVDSTFMFPFFTVSDEE